MYYLVASSLLFEFSLAEGQVGVLLYQETCSMVLVCQESLYKLYQDLFKGMK